MTQATKLETRIELAIRDFRRNHRKAVRTVTFLKRKINDLELSVSQEDCARAEDDKKKLNALIERLDGFVDSVISESARTREQCERLKHECKMQEFDPVTVENLETSCKETEQLAKDLLCYSLGHFRKASGAVR